MNFDIIMMLLVTNMITFFFTGYYCKKTFIVLGYKLGMIDEQTINGNALFKMVANREDKEVLIQQFKTEYNRIVVEIENHYNSMP
jgi:hypothetical protein